MFTDLMPEYATVKLEWHETVGFNVALAVGCMVVFLSVIPAAVIRFIQDRRMSGDAEIVPRGARAAYWVIGAISILNLAFVAGVIGVMQWGMTSELHPVSLQTKAVLALGVLAALLTIGALVFTAMAWKQRYWGTITRAYYTLVTGAAVAFIWFLDYWNLLGWRY
jgi:hypothetical protein